jgi:hypothetical protein
LTCQMALSRAGKGQVFPACEPDRVTAEALKRRNNGFSLRDLTLQTESIGSLSLIKVCKETPEKPLLDLPNLPYDWHNICLYKTVSHDAQGPSDRQTVDCDR